MKGVLVRTVISTEKISLRNKRFFVGKLAKHVVSGKTKLN